MSELRIDVVEAPPTSPDTAAEAEGTSSRALTGSARRFVHNAPGMTGAILVVLIALAGLIGPSFTGDPNLANVLDKLAPPSAAHPLGTDQLGRDLLARVLIGARVALLVSVAATALGLAIAMTLGVVAGYFGGILDEILSRAFDVIVTFPMILLGVLIVVALGPSLPAVCLAIGIAVTPRYGRQFRVLTKSVVQREYVQAGKAQGYSSLRMIARHVLPNIMLPIAVIAAGNMGRLAVAEASLSYLGAGIRPPDASWGNMISEGQQYLQTSPGLAVFPGIALCLLAIAFSFVGDALRDAFDLTE
jgi:ABC-type dipeptide/oligopeptide/nickel transport system permease subunit